MNRTITTFIIAAILAAGFIISVPLQNTFAADKTINCEDGCKINFKGKNSIDIQFGGGSAGQQGEKGDKGETGDQGPKGDKGDPGDDGKDGKDAESQFDEDTVNRVNELTGKIDVLNEIIQSYENGTLGVPSEVEEPENPPVVNETQPPVVDNGTVIDNGTTTNPPGENNTNPVPEPLPDNGTVDNGTVVIPPVDNQTSNNDNGTDNDVNDSDNG